MWHPSVRARPGRRGPAVGVYWMGEAADFPMCLENSRALTMIGEPHRAIEVLAPKVAAMADYPRDVT